MLNLFIGGIGSCSLAPHIALEEVGAAYKITRLDFSKDEQKKPEYLKINPKARVPALVTERGILTEVPAILLYIAQSHAKSNMAPVDDAFALAKMQAFNVWLCSTVHPNHAHGFRGARWSDDPGVIDKLKIKVPQNMTDNFNLIENDFLTGPWVMGAQFTIADCYLYTLATWMEGDSVDISKFPRVIDHRARMAARPAVQKVRATYA